ncbi:MAG TPA: hypothetical protein VKG38_11670 [Solirubrobacteraceae bacterium]|nr:hypothetical protein [Solirubrobacteraceae bacterium]
MLRYSRFRKAFVLRGIGNYYGPVLRRDRRTGQQQPFADLDRRRAQRRSPRRTTGNHYQRAAATCCLLALVAGIAVSAAASLAILTVALVFALVGRSKHHDYSG